MGDDGIGPRVAHALSRQPLPPNVEVVDGALGGLSILDWLDGRQRAIVVDAARMGRLPGTVVRFAPSETKLSMKNTGPDALAYHQAHILEILEFGRRLKTLPPVTIYGIEPDQVTPGDRLSACGRRALREAVGLILAELRYPQGDDEHGQVENPLGG